MQIRGDSWRRNLDNLDIRVLQRVHVHRLEMDPSLGTVVDRIDDGGRYIAKNT